MRLARHVVLIDYLRGVEQARELLHCALERDERVCASVLTRVELAIGVRRSEQRRTDALVAALHWLPVDGAVAEEADGLARR